MTVGCDTIYFFLSLVIIYTGCPAKFVRFVFRIAFMIIKPTEKVS